MSGALDAAVILAGGRARRFAGVDKALATVGGRPLLARVVDACRAAGAGAIAAVGPQRPFSLTTTRNLTWCREDPAGGGPVAAAHTGLTRLAPPPGARVALLAGDLPFLDAGTLRQLAAAVPSGSGAVLVDDTGRPQWLAGVWDGPALAAVLAGAAGAGPPGDRGPAIRGLLESLRPVRVGTPGRHPPPWWDCDDQADLTTARGWAAVSTLEEWMDAVATELRLPAALAGTQARDAVLDLARDVAHGVARPAAPVTAFLLGVAAGGGDPAAPDLAALTARVRALLPEQ